MITSYQESIVTVAAMLFSQDCSLLSGSLALEALLIGVHCKKRYINVYIQYNGRHPSVLLVILRKPLSE